MPCWKHCFFVLFLHFDILANGLCLPFGSLHRICSYTVLTSVYGVHQWKKFERSIVYTVVLLPPAKVVQTRQLGATASSFTQTTAMYIPQ